MRSSRGSPPADAPYDRTQWRSERSARSRSRSPVSAATTSARRWARHGLLEAGKVREIGCSNVTAAQLEEAAAEADRLGIRGFSAEQDNYSLLDRTPENELLPAAQRLGIAFIPYFPLASGMLTGKYRRD